MNSKIRVALLDVDGTLLDTNNAHAQAWVEALNQFGYHVPFSKIRPLIGMGGDHLLPMVTELEEESVEGKAITEARARIFKTKYLPDIEPFEGVRGLLQKMKDSGLKLVVATSSGKEALDAMLKRGLIDDLIDDAATKDDADNSKPSPDIVQAALAKSGVRADEAIMIGDTPYDIEAAARAGVRTVAFECGGWSILDLGQAAAVYKDAADLFMHFSSSPFVTAPTSAPGSTLKENFAASSLAPADRS